MTEKDKRLLLNIVNKEWGTLSWDSKKSFEKDHRQDLEFLYINKYLNKKFYFETGNAGLIFNPKVKIPLSKKGEEYISVNWINRINKRPMYIVLGLLIFLIVSISTILNNLGLVG